MTSMPATKRTPHQRRPRAPSSGSGTTSRASLRTDRGWDIKWDDEWIGYYQRLTTMFNEPAVVMTACCELRKQTP
jgi:hypothetical protein